MAEPVKFIEFKEVPNAPRVRLPADLSDEEVKDFLKSEAFERSMYERGFAYKYGLQPVDMLEMENLDDGSFHSSWKAGWDSMYAIGQGSLAAFYDFVGAKENQEEALQAAEQYLLDSSAHIFRIDEEGKITARPNTIEDIVNSEEQLTAFTKYLKFTSGNAAATSIPTLLLSAIGGGIGAVIGAAGGTLAAPGVGTAGGGVAGGVIGARLGAALSGYVFGLGDTYLAQREAGAQDPNVGLSMALAVPYAAVESIGIGGVVPSLINTFGTKEAAAKALQKGLITQIKNGQKGSLKKIPGMYAKGILKTGLEEGIAEAIQETLNVTAGGVASGMNFEELFNNKTFAKQLGEAAAAGFFGGWGFGTINPTFRTIKMLGKGTGPMDVKGGAAISNLDPVEESETIFDSEKFGIGDTVIVDNIMEPDIRNKETPLFGRKPQFKVVGTADIDGLKQFILSQRDLPAAIATVPVTDINMISRVDPPKEGGDPGEEYMYDTLDGTEQQPGTPNEKLRKQYSQSKNALEETGYIPNSKDETVDTFLGGKEKVVNNVVNEIEVERAAQESERMSEEDTIKFKEEYGYDPIIDKINGLFKKYEGLKGEELKEAVNKDYSFWRDVALVNKAEENAQENNLTKEDRETLTKLGYFTGPRGQEYIQRQIGNITSTKDKRKRTTEGRKNIKNIIKNKQPFSSLSALEGGPVTEKIEVGERITTREPLTPAQKASMTGDKLIPIMKYNPILLQESVTFEDLYTIPANERMRMILQLADALDSTGIKRKFLQQYKELRKEKMAKVNAARNMFGLLSDEYKAARQELKEFDNTGEHIVRADRQLGDIKESFRLFQILTPKAIRAAQKQIASIQRDSRFKSDNPLVKGPLVAELTAYQSLIQSAFRSRKQLNDLLRSLSIEPVLDWENMTLSSVKKQINKVRKQLAQTETEIKRRTIKGEFTRFNRQDPNYGSQPAILLEADESAPLIVESMRIYLDKLGLTNIDLAVLERVLAEIDGQIDAVGGSVQFVDEKIRKKFPNLPLGLIKVSFDLQKYGFLNDRLKANNYTDPKLKKADWRELNMMVGTMLYTLSHEGIHALKRMGLFSKKEWKMLEDKADKVWMKHYNVNEMYPPNLFTLEQRREEAIAFAFGDYAVERRDPNREVQNIFTRIKAFLLALSNGLIGAGFTTPESIFNKVEAGVVGERNKVQRETANIYLTKHLDNTMLSNPVGTVVMSNVYRENNMQSRAIQRAYLDTVLEEPGRVPTDESYSVKFTTNPDKIRWANKWRRGAIGLTPNVDPDSSIYTYMTPDQYLSLTMPLQMTSYDREALKFMGQAVVDGKEFGVPYLIIEITSEGRIGKVVGQEGRHRAYTAKGVNGAQSNMPVAIQFIHETSKYETSGIITQSNKRGEPINKRLISDFINDGVILGMNREVFREDPTTDAGALDETRDPFNVRERMKFESETSLTKQVISAVYE